VTGGAPDAAATNRGIALLRLAIVPLALILPGPDGSDAVFVVVLVLFGAYAVTMLALSVRADQRLPGTPQAIADLAWIAALVWVSGGADSPLRFAFYVMPIAAAVRLSPPVTALWLGLALAAYLVVAVPHPDTDLSEDVDMIVEQSLALLWVGAGAVMLSAYIARREQSLAALAEARRLLVRQALDAEARERRRLAEALHDEAIQNVLVARQEVGDAAREVPGALDRAREALDETSAQLREEIFGMHPLGLERAGLAAALRSYADVAAARGGFAAEVTVEDGAAGAHDELLLATARELLTNAAKHARAGTVAVRVAAPQGAVRLTVADDGVGLPHERLEHALAEGHIGLAAATERVRALGGDVEIESAPGGGTMIAVVLPR
jgi:two-component system NarL family sensor kinase